MMKLGIDPTNFNKFSNLDSVETRVIEYLRDSKSAEAERLWKVLKYTDARALFQENVSQKDKNDLIYKDVNQMDCRVFTFPYIEDEFSSVCSILKVYIHSIEPQNHLVAHVNVGIDILTHNKISNIYNDNGDILEGGRPIEANIPVKNRNTVMLKAILNILNGSNIEGVGVLQFNKEMTDRCQAQLKLSNNRNFYGYSLVFSCHMSGMGVAMNGFKSD